MKSVMKFLLVAALAIAGVVTFLTPAIGCEWTGYSYQGCWRVDYYLCPGYVEIQDVLNYIGDFRVSEYTWICVEV